MPVLRFNACPPGPWKNGGGITRQLLIYPPAANLDDFLLRVSVADVDSDGPFSRFAGIDRTLAIVTGKGLQLQQHGNVWQTLTPASPLLHFAGEEAISSIRLDGKVRDFNIMTRRSHARHQAQRLSVSGTHNLPSHGACLLFVASGEISISTGNQCHTLHSCDAFWQPAGGSLTLHAAQTCELIVATIAFEAADEVGRHV